VRTEPSLKAPVDVDAIPLQIPQVPRATHPDLPDAAQPALRAPAIEPAADTAPAPERAEPVPVAAAPQPLAPQRTAPPPRPRNLPEIPPITLALPLESGLELVQTTVTAPAPEDEPAPEPRPRRVRPPKPAAPDEPLQIVETRRDDGTTAQP
jgi:hypothetical protein